jgi:leucyl aminopeptidase
MTLPPLRLTTISSLLADIEADWLIAGVWEDGPLSPSIAALDERLGGSLKLLRERGDLAGKQFEIVTALDPKGIRATRLLFVGLGKAEEANRKDLHAAAAAALRSITGKKWGRVAVAVPETNFGPERTLLAFGVGAAQGSYGPGLRKTEASRFAPDEVILVVPGRANLESALRRAAVEASAVMLARELVNTPPCDLYPESFAARMAEAAGSFECEIWDERQLAAERMGAILGVAQGSRRPARLVVLRYRGGGDAPALALVGKGVTFDSGGLSLKDSDQMIDMKCDMAGAAAVFAAVRAVAELKLPVNLLGVTPLVENMPSGTAVMLGDVLHARNGKTIEILNTDAEGRVILADALAYAAEQAPGHIVDLATLTGSCMVALGTEIAGLMSNNEAWSSRVRSAITEAGERAWPLPMDEDFEELLESKVADLKNAPGTRYGGAIAGGKFLEQFVNKLPWVHLDIAGPAWADRDSASRDAGGTGAFVRSLIELAHQYGERR